MQKYMAKRRAKRRSDLFAFLGNRCNRCGISEGLVFDHIDPTTKSFQLSGRGLDRAWSVILLEVAKCQLLCKPCHAKKTGTERSVEHGGGSSGKKNCPCAPCKAKKKEYMASYVRTDR